MHFWTNRSQHNASNSHTNISSYDWCYKFIRKPSSEIRALLCASGAWVFCFCTVHQHVYASYSHDIVTMYLCTYKLRQQRNAALHEKYNDFFYKQVVFVLFAIDIWSLPFPMQPLWFCLTWSKWSFIIFSEQNPRKWLTLFFKSFILNLLALKRNNL